jgi:hypothetical protein
MLAAILLPAFGTAAQTTNALSEAEVHGRQLAQQILEQRPTENFTNTGGLQIRSAKGNQSEIPVRFIAFITPTNWTSFYETYWSGTNALNSTKLIIQHGDSNSNLYEITQPYENVDANAWGIYTNVYSSGFRVQSGVKLMFPFADSDFWLADLGLEFLHWPDQKILRGENMRGVFCRVLESTNPNPSTNGYSRVVSWIDNESLGIVEAKAYDAKGKLLKEFYPKNVKKVNGQWQVGSMEIDNIQTGSRTTLKFDSKAK